MKDKCSCCNSRNSRCSNDSIYSNIDSLNDELCDMNATLAATKANLINLVRIMCMQGCISDEEKELLLSIECDLNSLDCSICRSREYVNAIDNKLC